MTVFGTSAAVGLPTLTGTGQARPAATGTALTSFLPSLTTSGGGPIAGQQQAVTVGQGAATGEASTGQANPLGSLGGIFSNPLLGIGMTLGGAALGVYGLMKGKGFLKFSGAGTALSGLFMTYQGAKSQGREQGKVEGAQIALQQFQQQAQQQLGPMIEAQNQKIAQQQAMIAQLQGGGGTPGGTGTGAGTGTGTGAGTAVDPGSAGGVGAGTAAGTGSTAQAQSLPAAQWSAGALVGQAVTLGEARMPAGAQIAETGSFVISQPLGDPNGYATAAEADAAARQTMSTGLQGTKNYRWLVIEHGGRNYAFLAAKDLQGSAPQMPQANGNVAGWRALRAIDTGDMQVKWIEYSWSAGGGSSFNLFGEAGQTVASSGGTAETGITGVAGGGAATTTTPGANTGALVGRTFSVNAASTAAGVVDGGSIQLKGVVGSAVGYATAEEAASAARDARAALGASRWSRTVTLQLADGRFYAYQGQLVSRPTVEVGQLAAPLYVFGSGFAEYFNGREWAAQVDAA